MDTLSQKERSLRMSLVKSLDTKPEIELRQLVWSLGFRYRKNRRDIMGNPDLVFIAQKKAIFLHGCFWHRHDCKAGNRVPKSRLSFWQSKFSANIRRDALVKKSLKAQGWKSLIVWECELKNPDSIKRRIRKFLNA